MAAGVIDDERLVRVADLEQRLGEDSEHVLHTHDVARGHVDDLAVLFVQDGACAVRGHGGRADVEEAAAEIAPRPAGGAGLEVLDEQGRGDGGAFGHADDAVEGPLVFDDVVQVFQGDADAPGLGGEVQVFVDGREVALRFFHVAVSDVFQVGDAVFLHVAVVADVEEGGIPLEESEVRGAFQLFCEPGRGRGVEVSFGEVEGDVLIVRELSQESIWVR